MTDRTAEMKGAKAASLRLAELNTAVKDKALKFMAEALDRSREEILKANVLDVDASRGRVSKQFLKRLIVDDNKISDMIDEIRGVIALPDPVNEKMSSTELDEGLILEQVRCPIGTLGVIFESRPDVVPQIMSLCIKSGNGVVFKGGSEALYSNRVLFTTLKDAAYVAGIPKGAFVLMETREDVSSMLSMDRYIDLLIPRGSNSFVRYIQNNTHIPVLGHSSGICSVYVDSSADLEKAYRVVLDSKIQYPAACNAAEDLLVDRRVAERFLPHMAEVFRKSGVEMRVSDEVRKYIPDGIEVKTAVPADPYTEYGDMIISVDLVDGVRGAVDFINNHGSHHTDVVITENEAEARIFTTAVDSADVFVNASTRFADGYRFGKGAEVGISTNKIHARGPVGMEGLMIYKYVLRGNGQIVKDYTGDSARKFPHRRIHVRDE